MPAHAALDNKNKTKEAVVNESEDKALSLECKTERKEPTHYNPDWTWRWK